MAEDGTAAPERARPASGALPGQHGLSYTPPAASAGSGEPVRRRRVFYVPGYDHKSRRRYHALFGRELGRYVRRFDVERTGAGPAVLGAGGLVQGWDVDLSGPGWRAQTRYEVLLWDDLVRTDLGRSIGLRILLLFVGVFEAVATGTLFRFYRLSPIFGTVVLYPFATVLLLALAAAGLGAAVWAGAGAAGAPEGVALALGIGTGLVVPFVTLARLDGFFVRHLVHDWVFNWQLGRGARRDYAARTVRFTRHVVEATRGSDVDEVLIVGHSSGALMAVEIAAGLLEADGQIGSGRTAVSVLTLGSSLPLVALNPSARAARAAIAALVRSDRATWLDVFAPQDWLNFPGFNPVRDLDLQVPPAEARNPFVRSAKLKETMTPDSYRALSFRPYRTHFQFLMANGLSSDYDFFAATAGPQRLRDRIARPYLVPLREEAPFGRR